MHTIIEDSNGQTWDLSLGVDEYRRVRTEVRVEGRPIDLGLSKYPGPSGVPLATEIYESPGLLIDICWTLLRKQGEKHRLNKQDFENAFFAKLTELRDAFFQEWEDFFRCLGRTTDAEALANFRALILKKMQDALTEQKSELGDSSTTSSKSTPPSQESPTRAPTRSES